MIESEKILYLAAVLDDPPEELPEALGEPFAGLVAAWDKIKAWDRTALVNKAQAEYTASVGQSRAVKATALSDKAVARG